MIDNDWQWLKMVDNVWPNIDSGDSPERCVPFPLRSSLLLQILDPDHILIIIVMIIISMIKRPFWVANYYKGHFYWCKPWLNAVCQPTACCRSWKFSLLSKFFHHKATCLTWCQVFALGLMSFPSSRLRKSVLELGFHPMCGRSPRAPGDKQLRKFRKLPNNHLTFSLLTHFSHGVSLKSAILMMQHFLMISTGKACFSAVIIWNISIIWGFFQLKNC